VKCDEQRPSCNACSRLKLRCTYSDGSITSPQIAAALYTSLVPAPVPLKLSTPFIDQGEWQYFRLFQDHHIKWYLNSPCQDQGLCTSIWRDLIVPLMHRNLLFKHIVLATSAAHTFSYPDGTTSSSYSGVPAFNETFFLQHYGQALKLTSEAHASKDATTVLAAAACLCVIELCRHRPTEFLFHLNSATNLLQRWLGTKYLHHEVSGIGRSAMTTLVAPILSKLKRNQDWVLQAISPLRIK
jgi:hypothetical protein